MVAMAEKYTCEFETMILTSFSLFLGLSQAVREVSQADMVRLVAVGEVGEVEPVTHGTSPEMKSMTTSLLTEYGTDLGTNCSDINIFAHHNVSAEAACRIQVQIN